MSQPLIITLLLLAFVLPVLGAVVLRLITPRLAPVQLYGAAIVLLAVVVASVLVLARGDIPSLQIGNLSILLPVTAPDDSFLPLVPTTPAQQSPVPPILATAVPVTATAVLTATLPPLDPATNVPPTAAATQTATAEPSVVPTASLTATPAPTAVPPTAIPPTAAPAPPAAPRTYTVQPGDTLLSIAKQFKTTVTAIVEANKLTPQQADSLRVGQELVIP